MLVCTSCSESCKCRFKISRSIENILLNSSVSKIIAASDIEVQRTEFSTLSNEFIALAKKSGVKSGELYIDYCPMALNDKGAYWLSASEEIKNPYFGDKMLTCGEVKEPSINRKQVVAMPRQQ